VKLLRAKRHSARILALRMIEHSRYRGTALLLALVLQGCLPEPPAYDPCVNETSAYFSVVPQGCNGHELTTLWEQRREGTAASISARPTEIVLGNDGIYWTDGDGNIVHAARSSNAGRIVFKLPAEGARVFDFDPDNNRLYTAGTVYDAQSRRITLQIFGIDIATGESRLLADLPDTTSARVDVIGNRFYITNDFDSALLTGPLDWESTAKTSDLRSCVPASLMSQSVISKNTLYNLSTANGSDTAPSMLTAVDLTPCSTVWTVALEIPSVNGVSLALSAAEGQPYLQECDDIALDCSLFSVASDGTREPVVRGYFDWASRPTTAGSDVYVVANAAGNSAAQPTRLYTWGTDRDLPIAIAAPLASGSQVVVDAEYVYALQDGVDTTDGVFENADTSYVVSSRIVRIRR
jgi:hypothetical protein